MFKIFTKKIFRVSLLVVFFFAPIFYINAVDATSTNFTVSNSIFGSGQQMDSTTFSLQGALSNSQDVSYASGMLPLVPGNITSCGKIVTAGTYTVSTDLSNISGPCFVVLASNVNIDGANHIISGTSSNTSYAVMATSSVVDGGSSYININIQNIVFNNFGGGVNASGNSGTLSGGNGGSVVIASSTMGSVIANGGSSSLGIGGSGGSISISGTNLKFAGRNFSASGGSGVFSGSSGVITVNGTVLISNSEVWSGNDSAWLGTREWSFVDNAYNTGTTTGTTTFSGSAYNNGFVSSNAVFSNYVSSGGGVEIDSDSNFHGTGKVGGTVLDSLFQNITAWSLINASVLTGYILGDITFNDTSYNDGTIFDNAVFNDNSHNSGTVLGNSTFNNFSYNAGVVDNATFTAQTFNSVAGIPNADPTGLSNGHSVLGDIIFSATTSPVIFNVNTGSVWGANTSSWIFATAGQSWVFNFANNTGVLSGNASFSNGQNAGTVNGNSTFYTNSYNSGTTASAYFYNNSYNKGTSANASFYGTSMNSGGAGNGNVTVRCDFYESSLPGTGSCALVYYHIPYYFNGGAGTDWGDVGSWFFDASSTEPTNVLPQNGDMVYIGAEMTNGPSSSILLGSIMVASSTTGGGSFSVDFTNASGPAYFYSSSTNAGVVDGVFHIFGNRSLSSVNVSGTYTDNVAFHNGSWNDTNINADAVFYDSSFNATNGVVNGNAEFAGTNRNDGIVVGVATINQGASLSGSGTVQNNVINSGNISGGVFNNIVTNISGSITGSISNLVRMIFNGGSYVSNTGQLSGEAEFNASSSNRGVVTGTSTFNNSSYNIGTTSVATFVGDLSENIYNGVSGFVSGVKTRLYTALAPQLNLFRDFTDSAWTIVADNTLVKLLFGNCGFIFRSLNAGSINTCGVLDQENATYTLSSNISNYAYDTCFVVRANNVTLNGNGYEVSANSSSTSLYAVVSTSTLSVDATSSAFTNLTIKNIKFINFASGLMGRGTDVPDGIGGNGTTVTIDHTTIGDIDVSGGDPIEQAGHGGDVTLETSITNVIASNGGDSTGCGIPGNGGNISITTDSVYATTTNRGGIVSGCPENVTPTYGSRGRLVNSVISNDTRSRESVVFVPQIKTSGSARIFDFAKIVSFLLPVNLISPINFSKLPSFSDVEGKNSFSFIPMISRFIFAPLPKEMDLTTSNVLKSLGIKYEKDFVSLKQTSLLIKSTKNIPGLFDVSVKGIPIRLSSGAFDQSSNVSVTSYLIYSSKNSVSQQIKVNPKTEIIIRTNFERKSKIYFNNKELVFVNNEVKIIVPSKPGRYAIKSSDSPIPLVIEVVGSPIPENTQIKEPSLLKKVTNWFVGLFK